ncbi:hypothetical protein AAF712_009125 [Marasmius tenuissimus]|uniref:F-box domain-containing protein n=1 Tax=Marasmius tenuissimus TaxID=585030 RepID=A0ABR2ZRP1_9AGAR
MSPLLHTPSEVLSEIFRRVHDINLNASRRLSQVCTRWRDAVINDPILWSNIDIDIMVLCVTFPLAAQKIDNALLFLETALSRSKDVDLHVHFVHVLPLRQPGDPRDELGCTLFRALLDHSPRFASLTFVTDIIKPTNYLVPYYAMPQLPRLHTLYLEVVAPSGRTSPDLSPSIYPCLAANRIDVVMTKARIHYLKAFGSSPFLRRLYLPHFPDTFHTIETRADFVKFLCLYPHSFSGLTHLIIGDCPKRALVNFIRASRASLNVCEVFVVRSDFSPPLQRATQLPHLRVLTIPSGHKGLPGRLIVSQDAQINIFKDDDPAVAFRMRMRGMGFTSAP